jgi:phage baseplate assembly protein W
MAYGLKNIPIVDLYPSKGVGVKIPFESDSVFTSTFTTKDQLRYNIINYLLSDPRERPFNPTFGAGLRSKIFEQISTKTVEEIKDSLGRKLQNTFPNIEVVDLSVETSPNESTILISFSYRIINTAQEDTVNLEIQN